MGEPIAAMREVAFSYDGVHDVIADATVSLEEGGVYALVGPNGAGKSTTVGLLTGRLTPRSGWLRVGGEGRPEALRAKTAVVTQELALFDELTVYENLWLAQTGRTALSYWDRTNATRFAKAHLQAVGIDLPVEAQCRNLTFPERQKLEISRALVSEPRILFLDEPTSALDGRSKRELYALLGGLHNQGITVVIVSHDAAEVVALDAEPIVVIAGKISQNGETSRNLLKSAQLSPARELADPPQADSERAFGGGRFELEFQNHVRASVCRCPVSPGHISLVHFDDALDRAMAVEALRGRNGYCTARFRRSCEEPWVELPAAANGRAFRTVSTDKRRDSLFPGLSVLDNAMLISHHTSGGLFRNKSEETAVLRRMAEAASIVYPSPNDDILAMSGGNQQRTVLAACMEYGAEILALEEPLMGLDEASHGRILALLLDYVRGGRCLLIATCFGDSYALAHASHVTFSSSVDNSEAIPDAIS